MPRFTQESVVQVLGELALPDAEGMSVADALHELELSGGGVAVVLRVGYPMGGAAQQLEREMADALRPLGVEQVSLKLEWFAAAAGSANEKTGIPGVTNIIAVASGKGGVGKSTTSANLALALAAEGARVGILDADIYGPSQPQMLGVGGKRPATHGTDMIEPIQALGLQCVSMGNLVTEKTPMVWRGPMASGALQQLLNKTHWTDVDYLIVDMPPGTGDIQLTLAQSVPVSAAVIVTTPQDIALLDAKKGIEMFRKVNIPVLGVVENMALHICTQCGHQEAIFGEEGGQKLAAEYDVRLLGQLPLRLDIRQQTDSGTPPVAADPESEVSQIYRKIARQVAAGLWRQAQSGNAGPEISISDD